MAGTVKGFHHGGGADTALEAAAGFGTHAVGAAGQADAGTVEAGALEHHFGGGMSYPALPLQSTLA